MFYYYLFCLAWVMFSCFLFAPLTMDAWMDGWMEDGLYGPPPERDLPCLLLPLSVCRFM